MLINMFDIIIRINNFFTILASGDESKYNIVNIYNRNLLVGVDFRQPRRFPLHGIYNDLLVVNYVHFPTDAVFP